jgi:hypothetical protein
MTESADHQLRDFPLPFSAMLSIVNDIDGTHLSTFRELHEFLNTDSETRYGVGLGLDIADSFWMYGPKTDPRVMSYYPNGGGGLGMQLRFWSISNGVGLTRFTLGGILSKKSGMQALSFPDL